jgi:hypothetical protein
MNFDEPSSVCSANGAEIEAARLASETPGLTQNSVAFIIQSLEPLTKKAGRAHT